MDERDPSPRRRRLAGFLRLCAWTLAVLVLAYGAAQAAARVACRNGALRARIVSTLEARIGPVELGPEVRVDPFFRVRFGPLNLSGAAAARPGAPLVRVESV